MVVCQFFPQVFGAINHYMRRLTGHEGIMPPNCRVSKILQSLLQKG